MVNINLFCSILFYDNESWWRSWHYRARFVKNSSLIESSSITHVYCAHSVHWTVEHFKVPTVPSRNRSGSLQNQINFGEGRGCSWNHFHFESQSTELKMPYGTNFWFFGLSHWETHLWFNMDQFRKLFGLNISKNQCYIIFHVKYLTRNSQIYSMENFD